jgi:serine/threonine-protein kinase
LDALTLRLLAKDPEDRYASAVELAGGLERVRIGPSPLSVATETTTAEMTAEPVLSVGEKRPKRMATHPSAKSPMGVVMSGRRVRGRLLRTLAAALCGVILLGGLAWALTQNLSTPGPSSSEEASSSEEVASTEEAAASATAQEAPEPYYASETEGALADDAGLEIGDLNEASDDAVPAGYAIKQDPEAGTTVGEGAAVDVAVDTGPEQSLVATQAAPTNVDAVGSQGVLTAQPAASKAADLKQVPAAVQEAPSSVGAADSRQDAPSSRAASATIQTTSGSSVSDKKEQKGREKEQKGKK